jgi:tetratricopeptide (TPR) repeat protein
MSDTSRIDDLKRRVEDDPASIAFAQLGEEYRRQGLLLEAIDVCRRGLSVHPSYISARLTLARALLQHGDLDGAAAELQIVLAAAPNNLAARRALGELHRKRGDDAAALSIFESALTIAPNDPEIERSIADLSAQIERRRLEPERLRALATIAALEGWLQAIHVTRAEHRA